MIVIFLSNNYRKLSKKNREENFRLIKSRDDEENGNQKLKL